MHSIAFTTGMPYSKAQAERVRRMLAGRRGVTEKEMFGGIAFLLGGNMCVGVHGEDLIVRVEPGQTATLLREPRAKPFSLSARPGMPGWLLVGPSGYKTDAALKGWIARDAAYFASDDRENHRPGPAPLFADQKTWFLRSALPSR